MAGQLLHERERGERDSVPELKSVQGSKVLAGNRLRQPRTWVRFPFHPGRTQLVQREPGHHRQQEGPRLAHIARRLLLGTATGIGQPAAETAKWTYPVVKGAVSATFVRLVDGSTGMVRVIPPERQWQHALALPDSRPQRPASQGCTHGDDLPRYRSSEPSRIC